MVSALKGAQAIVLVIATGKSYDKNGECKMKANVRLGGSLWSGYLLHLMLLLLLGAVFAIPAHAVRSNAPITGEIQFISVDNPADHWSGGIIVVGGQNIILPRNLLLDLPANRMTLAQLFAEAPPACLAVGQSGLAKGDSCNTTGMGGIASIAANRTTGGNIIAGDVLIEKGVEAVTGEVTYIDYNDGYFRLNGNIGDPATGVMVRLNDPDARHTVQQGLGCNGGPNCSPDPRFTLDGDNYTNVFTSGFPFCIPSTQQRVFDGSAIGLPASAISQAQPAGTGDLLCPTTNRTVNGGQPVDDSRRFAPVMLGDSLTAEGNFERVNGVQFLSAHSSMITKALTTKNDPTQPDYLFLDEVEVDVGGFQNQRARTLIIGYSTLAPSDILIWTIHYDPVTNAPHEFPLASVLGCDIADGPGTCGQQGLVGTGNAIFKIRHDVDFLVGAKPRLNPCAHLRADPRFGPLNICPTLGDNELNITEQLAILSPMPREIQARTGHSMANPGQVTLDVSGNVATNGQYLFPFGANLGGVSFPEFNEINLDALNTPFFFTSLPWTLDRRLSPGGCNGPCESTPQPLDPYPFEGLDPRTQASLPSQIYNDPNYTNSPLSTVRNRIFSYVDPSLARLQGNGFETPAAGNFNGNATVLAWPPADPAAQPILVTPLVNPNTAPVAVADTAITVQGVPVTILVLANDTDAQNNPLSIIAVGSLTPSTAGTYVNNGSNVTFNPSSLFTGVATFSYTITDGNGGTATAPVSVTVTPGQNQPPVAAADSASTASGTPVTINVLANDTDANGDPLSVISVTNGARGTVANNGVSVTYTPNAGTSGTDLFSYTVADGRGGTASGSVTVNVAAPESLAVSLSEFRAGNSEWRVAGTSSAIGATITVRRGVDLTGPVIGTATVSATRTWILRVVGSAILPDASRTISIHSSGGTDLLGVPVTVR
jgi:hypothetical protein